MPTHAVIATALQDHAARDLEVYVGGRRLTDYVDWDTFRITDDGTSGVGTLFMRLLNVYISALPELYDQARVRVIDFGAARPRLFTGYVTSRHPMSIPTYDDIDVRATDIGALMDDIFIAYERRRAESLRERVAFLWGKYAGTHLSRDIQYVNAFGGTLEVQEFVSLTLRQALQAAHAQASSLGDDYVDQHGRVHVFRTHEVNAAPFDINIDSPGSGEIAPEDLDIDWSGSEYANVAYVQGKNAAGSAYVYDHGAVAAANGVVRMVPVQAPDSTNRTMANNIGTAFLRRVSSGKPRGTFSTSSPNDGWEGGQILNVTAARYGLTAEEFRIHSVTTSIMRPGDSKLRRYDVKFGA